MKYTIHDAIETLRHLEAAENGAYQLAYGPVVLGDDMWRPAMDLWERIRRIVWRVRDWPMGRIDMLTVRLIRVDVAKAIQAADTLAVRCREEAGDAGDHPLHRGAQLAHEISENLQQAIAKCAYLPEGQP